MVWVGTSCRWGRGRVACWCREVAGALCAARWPLARRKIARHRMLNLGETRRKHVSGIFWMSKRRHHCNEHPKAALRHDAPNPRAVPANFFHVDVVLSNVRPADFSCKVAIQTSAPYSRTCTGTPARTCLWAFARAHDRLMCSNYARGHARKYVWAHALASFYVQLLHRNGAFSCDFRQVSGRRR